MPKELALLKTSVSEGPAGTVRVEIAISDTPDTALARESLCFSVEIGQQEHPLLIDELRLAALQRVQAIIAPHIAALSERARKGRSRF